MFEESNGQFLRHICHSDQCYERKAYFRNIVDVKEKHFGTYESVIKNIKTIKFYISTMFQLKKDVILYHLFF